MEFNNISRLGRPIDLEYFTNRLILTVTMFSFLIVAFVLIADGEEINSSLLKGARTGLTLFLLWAISRELDPDEKWSAFASVAFGIPLVIYFGIGSILPLLWLLLVLRMVVHSTGMPAGIMDSSVIFVLGSILAYNVSWIYALLTSVAFLSDSRLVDPARYHLQLGLVMFLLSVIVFLYRRETVFELSLNSLLITLIGLLLFLPLLISPSKVSSVGDNTGDTLHPARIKVTRAITVIIFICLAQLPQGYTETISLSIFFVFAGTGCFQMTSVTLKRLHGQNNK